MPNRYPKIGQICIEIFFQEDGIPSHLELEQCEEDGEEDDEEDDEEEDEEDDEEDEF